MNLRVAIKGHSVHGNAVIPGKTLKVRLHVVPLEDQRRLVASANHSFHLQKESVDFKQICVFYEKLISSTCFPVAHHPPKQFILPEFFANFPTFSMSAARWLRIRT